MKRRLVQGNYFGYDNKSEGHFGSNNIYQKMRAVLSFPHAKYPN